MHGHTNTEMNRWMDECFTAIFILSLPGLLLLFGGSYGCEVGFNLIDGNCVGKYLSIVSHIHTVNNVV